MAPVYAVSCDCTVLDKLTYPYYGLKIVLGTQGILNKSLMAMDIIDKPLRLMYTETAVMIGLVYILLPFMILPLYSAIEKLDNTYIEAAKT